jgi:hypothetical protein
LLEIPCCAAICAGFKVKPSGLRNPIAGGAFGSWRRDEVYREIWN